MSWTTGAAEILYDDGDASARLFTAAVNEAVPNAAPRRGYSERVLAVDAERLAASAPPAFVHDGVRYALETGRPIVDAAPTAGPGTPSAVYVDLTEAWTAAELASIRDAAAPLPLKVYTDDDWAAPASLDAAAAFAKTRPRSLARIPQIDDHRGALLVTRDQDQPLGLEAIRGRPLHERLGEVTCDWRPGANLAVFHLGQQLPPYLSSLAGTGAVTVEMGDFETLRSRLREGRRRVSADGPGIVEFDHGRRRITALPTDAPDTRDADPALLQLYAARQATLASHTTELSEPEQEARMAIASVGNVVTPFSSLIVLERAGDYARFGIEDRVGFRRDAPPADAVVTSADLPEPELIDAVFESGAGSVPEPEEWALIIVSLVTVAFVGLRRFR